MYYERLKAAELGKKGEEIAASYLKEKGYVIIKRNWHDSRYGEIDLVAETRKEVVFAEVRTRSGDALVSGAESVDLYKLSRVKSAALSFMNKFNSELPFRVDVIEITYYNRDNKEKWDIRHIKNV